jgi:hypothetical protein
MVNRDCSYATNASRADVPAAPGNELFVGFPNDEFTPLALFLPKIGTEPRLVTSTDIDKVMRNTASRVYNLDPIRHKSELQRWSSHSLRVGACTILHSVGFNNTQIKWLLRWRSDAFMTYLRNLAVNSRHHVLAMDQAAAMPQFL